MPEVKVIKKKKEPINVVLKQRKSRRWSAWVDASPKISAGGKTAMAAVGNLIRSSPELFGIVIVGVEQYGDQETGGIAKT